MDADGFVAERLRSAVFLGMPAGSAARTWFEAPTAGGPLRLSVAGAARHAADAAITLESCAPLLDALDEWVGTALAWRWVARPLTTTGESHACASWQPPLDEPAATEADVDASSRHQLELPWMLLRGLPEPPPALTQQLQWLAVPFVLAIAQLRIDADELALLEPRGAVILPASLQPGWRGVLRAFEEPARPGWGVPVSLELPLIRRERVAAAADINAEVGGCDRPWCEVRLGASRALPADRLAGWYEGGIGDLGAQASLWRCATDREAARPLATGRLMPWGAGWALAIESLCEPTGN